MGRYLIVVRAGEPPDELEVIYPVQIRRQGQWEGRIRLVRDVPPDYVFIPAGPFIHGGDRQAPGAGRREERWLDDFAIRRLPVTCAEYLEFLHMLERVNPGEASRRAPRPTGRGLQEPLWPRGADGGFRIPRVDILGGRWSVDMAVRSISREDAEAFCAWRATVDRLPLRLPTELEWEKAARGVDGRFFPWGNEFDATFCKMKDSRPGPPEPEPVGAFPLDCSPYGVQDLAGGVLEWVAGPFDRHGIMGIQKGGFWMASQANCRLARRFGVFPTEPEPFGGFRLAFTPG
jgi:serine/threonine-protein kinase